MQENEKKWACPRSEGRATEVRNSDTVGDVKGEGEGEGEGGVDDSLLEGMQVRVKVGVTIVAVMMKQFDYEVSI